MTVASHLIELRKKHEALSEKIELEQRSPGADDLELKAMKVQKLKLKEQITRLAHGA
ncbi:MAG: DUF465 domain-containing protein [Pseudomonadota bacterium]